jgi:hypothetical protein
MDMYIRAEDLDEETLLELDELGYGKTYKVASKYVKEIIPFHENENVIFIFKRHCTIDYITDFFYVQHHASLLSIDELRDKLGLKPRKYVPHMLK